MNKKFSTLVASLLLSSAFSVYAGNAKPMLATPTQVETRATSTDVEAAVPAPAGMTLPQKSSFTNLSDRILDGFTNNAAIFVANPSLDATQNGYLYGSASTAPTLNNVFGVDVYSSAVADYYYWTLSNGHLVNNAGQTLSFEGDKDYFEVIPLLDGTDATPYFVLGMRDNKGNLTYLSVSGTTWSEQSTLGNATVFMSVETAYNTVADVDDMNNQLGGGFNLFISSKIDDDAEVNGVDAFAGKLTAEGASGSSTTFKIKNAAGLYVVFEKSGVAPSDPVAEQGEFKLVKSSDIDATKHVTDFAVRFADNGSDDVYVTIGTHRLYIAHVLNTYSLSYVKAGATNIDNINYALTSLSANNYVDLKQFLQGKFVTIDFVSADMTEANNAYKAGGRLAVLDNNKADYVAASGLYEKAPEAQWAVQVTGSNTTYDNEIKFVNRENPDVSFTIAQDQLRHVAGKADTYETVGAITSSGIGAKEQIKITFVEDHTKTDGYAVFEANDLRNKTWYLGQTRQTADGDINVYWAENHGTHQIGATVEEANATKWNLSLVNKENVAAEHQSETDSVLVVTNLDTWVASKSRVESVKDTLVILPYAFQNRSNSEFVKFNAATNLNYYECDAENKKIGYVYGTDAIFALKMKADGTYNYVSVAPRKNDASTGKTYYNNDGGVVAVQASNNTYKSYAAEKVFQENSTLLGTWSHMDMYKKDANSLMFVTEVTAPEYRKLVSELGVDTVKIYRAENASQVVYEKRDAKSVVEGRTLSFLNIDNETQFTEINPALYVDTAYVNRGNNTRYQYLLGVNVTEHKGYYCPDHGFAEERPCEHAVPVAYKTGRYLINMIDTANVYGANVNIHNNPYINETEEGLDCTKLSFVDAIHVLEDADATKTDKLYIINNADSKDKYTVIDLSTPDFNIAKFAFKYVDYMNSDEFKIQTLYKKYIAESNPGANDAKFQSIYANDGSLSSEEGYLRWVNGCVVVDNGYAKGDVFNMNEDETRTPTANEEISAEAASVVVAGTNGAVVVKGAEGKSVIVSTILGKVVANEVLTSDNATIAAPAGVVVVSVDGESFKVVVK